MNVISNVVDRQVGRWGTALHAGPFPEDLDNAPTSQAGFVNLKQHPDHIKYLPEAREWAAFGDLLINLNKLSVVITLGCGTITDDKKKYPYIDIGLLGVDKNPEPFHGVFHDHLFQGLKRVVTPVVLEIDLSTITIGFSHNGRNDVRYCIATRLWFNGSKNEIEKVFEPLLKVISDFAAEHQWLGGR